MPVKDFNQTLTEAFCWLFLWDVPDLENNEFLNSYAFGGIVTAFNFGFCCPLGFEGMFKSVDYKSIMDHDTIAGLSALHHYWNQLMEYNPEKCLVNRVDLPLPDPNKTNQVTFLRLWLPEPMRVQCYACYENKLLKPLMVKYDVISRMPNHSLIERVKATLASCSASMLRCLLIDRGYAKA